MLRTACLLVLVMSAATSATLHAQRAPATAELLAGASAVEPGQTFTVGVLITMRPRWHVYWKYPGEAGLPTTVTFAAPGLTFSDLRWPTPTTFEQGDGKVGFGYADRVLLTARATAAADLKPGQTITLAADAEWLCCETECLPGSKRMTLKLPVAERLIPTYAKLFDEWEKRLPAPADATTPKLEVAVERNSVTITAPAGVEVFPAPPAGIALSNLRIERRGEQRRLRFDTPADAARLTSVKVVITSNGRGYESELSLR